MTTLPFLTDTRDHLERAVAQVKAAGGTSIAYSALHLKPGTKEWYFQWLESAHPELLSRYHSLYSRGIYDPKEYRRWLAAKLSPTIRRHGLERTTLEPATGIVGSRTQLRIRDTGAERSPIAEEMPPKLALRAMWQPMLF
ncbi:hypothetical protein FB472_0290 [Rhodoglobus vestalii]|uniref:Radical SAM protein n=1 Tax=Rhodoglobus vestalii TaxID=193384 RepID=A0A8H2K4X6_9MICO|nr:hypothetical protein FB472_0290 [Rhodoglobus vestalii]